MFFDMVLSNVFWGYVASGKGNKSKNEQVGLYKTKKAFKFLN